jgi:hypothetical protein
MVDERKKKTATPSESGRRSTLDSNPQKSDLWWHDADYHDKVPPIIYDDSAPCSKEFAAYRSFLIEKGLSEYDGQTLRYMVALEDEYRDKIKDYNEQLDTAINNHNQLQEQYTLLRDEKTALQIQLADFDEKNILEEITSLREEKAALEGQLADTERQLADTKRHQDDTRTPDVDEKLMEQVLDLRQELAAAKAATAAAQAAVVQAVNLRSGETPGASSFHINPRHLPTYDGTRDAKTIVDFLSDIKRAFGLRCHEIGWLREGQPEEDGWSPYAIARLRGAAGRWADGKYPPSGASPKWADFERSLRAEFTPLNTVRELVEKWAALRLAPNGHVATFNEEFRELRQQLDLIPEHALTPVQTVHAYIQKVRSNSKAHEHLTAYDELRQDMWVDLKLESAMQYTAKLDRKEVKNKEAEISAMYLNNNGRNRGRDRKKDDGKKAATRIDFSSVVPGGKGLGPGGRLGPEQCAVCYANGHMSWECKSKKDPEKKEEKKGDKRKRGSRGGKHINVVEEEEGDRKIEELGSSESESEAGKA